MYNMYCLDGNELDCELVRRILDFVNVEDLLNASLVCRSWNIICKTTEDIWHHHCTKKPSFSLTTKHDCRKRVLRLQKPLPRMKILFGSQTGTSETLAYELENALLMRNVDVEVVDLEFFDLMMWLEEYKKRDECELLVLILSTYGKGPTDNAVEFTNTIMDPNTPNLDGVYYMMFGVGSSNHKRTFNAMAKGTDARFQKLGAQRLYQLGLGDDNHDLRDDWETWREGLIDYLAANFSLEKFYQDQDLGCLSLRGKVSWEGPSL